MRSGGMEEILVVEDDPDIAHLVELALKAESFGAHVAPNAEAALSALGKRDFSACILDIMLPGMDGLSFLRTLRSMKSLERLPIIIASAKDDDSDIVAGLSWEPTTTFPSPSAPGCWQPGYGPFFGARPWRIIHVPGS